MEFASEMVMKASLAKLRVAEVPITLHKDGRSRPPHLRSWQDGWRHLRFMLLHCPMWLFCVPAIVLFTAGLAVGIRLLFGPLVIGNIGFDTNTLLVCAMAIIIGQQIATFGLFARKFASLQRILPRSERLEKILSCIGLEKGLIVGILLILFGLAALVVAFLSWRQEGYGAMSYPQSLRIVIPAVTLITTGVQLCFSSFFFQLLAIASKSNN